MTIKTAILQSLDDLKKKLSTPRDVYNHIINHEYYYFEAGKTPKQTVSSLLGAFIKNNDTRVGRIKGNGNFYLYYLTKYEQNLNLDEPLISNSKKQVKNKYGEKGLHMLLSSYLKSNNVFSKTIPHEKSKSSKDENQIWIHPDMVGISYLNIDSIVNKRFIKVVDSSNTFKLTSYEIKREIKTDYELKKCYFQTVSNSSWANYGYLVVFEINKSVELSEEMKRLNDSFGIGIIELKANPFESKVLFQSKLRKLDFKTIDKLCKVNKEYENFISINERILTIDEKNHQSVEKDLDDFCDKYLEKESEIEAYCEKHNIPKDSSHIGI